MSQNQTLSWALPKNINLFRTLFWVLLYPLAVLWAWISVLRRGLFPSFLKTQSKLKVISIGNIHSGGSGKTPFVLEIIKKYTHKKPVVLARGYRGELSQVGAKIDPLQSNGAHLYGDEPWMLSELTKCPVYICSKRKKHLKEIEFNHPESWIVLDDGFQHLQIKRDLDIVLVNANKNPEELFCLPMGELREPLSSLRQAHLVVLLLSNDELQDECWVRMLKSLKLKDIYFIRSKTEGFWNGVALQKKPVKRSIAFCGIADPKRFKDSLGAYEEVIWERAYPDHYKYNVSDIEYLIASAKNKEAEYFITTDKDWVKVEKLFDKLGLKDKLLSLRIGIEIPDSFWQRLEQIVK